jgi:hypothetical protein
LLCWSIAGFSSEVLIITGKYTGKDLYVQNPMLPDNHFSTEQVYVNESLVLSYPMTSAYTIDLSFLDLNELVEVKIVHKEHYHPKIVNAYVIRGNQQRMTSSNSYAAVDNVFRWINVDGTTIRWLTHGEKGGGTFEVQQAEKEKWVTVSEVPSSLSSNESVYRYSITHRQGENVYRIKLTDRDGYVTYSNQIDYMLK